MSGTRFDPAPPDQPGQPAHDHCAFAATGTRLLELGYSRKISGEQPLNLDVRVYRQEMERQIYAYANWLNRDIVTNKVTFQTDGIDAKADWLVHPQHLVSFGVNAWEMTGNPDRWRQPPASRPSAPTTLPERQDHRRRRLRAGRHALRQIECAGRPALRHGQVERADSMNNGARTTGLDGTDNAFSGNLGAPSTRFACCSALRQLRPRLRAPGMRERYESGVAATVISTPAAPRWKPKRPTSSSWASRAPATSSSPGGRPITTASRTT